MIEQQQKLVLSPYMEIYELVIPKDNLLRQIKELVDFSFIYDELLANYCLDNGRNAVPPIRMFKYLLLKSIYDLSDVDVVERSKYDMSFKYFLDMAPEDEVINPSSLTKFRKLRLKDMNLLDMLIAKTVQLALEKGIIKSKSIIVDATHTKSRYNQKTPRQVLQEQSKNLRRSIYEIDETMKEKFPDKNTEDSLEKELKYCKQLIDVVKGNEEICSYPKVQEKLNLLEESVTDDMEHLETSKDEDAKTGHKTADTSFFGYKTHIAMTEERIITAATITSGEKTDGKELPKLVQKSKAAGIQIESVIGDMAYSEKKNIEAAKEDGYELIAKLNPVITQGNRRKEDEFEFNKDAGMYQCKAGHLAIHKYFDKRKKDKKNKNPRMVYFFDIEKCKCCPYRDGCYKVRISGVRPYKSDYYKVLLGGKVVRNGLSVLRPEYIILFKAKAYLDLKMRRDSGEKVDSGDIKKHKKDVLRIAAELILEKVEDLPITVNADIHSFIESLKQEPSDQNSLKRYGLKNEDIVSLLKEIFGQP